MGEQMNRSPGYNDKGMQDIVYVLLILTLIVVVLWATGLLEVAMTWLKGLVV